MRRKYYKYMVVMAITAAMVLSGCSKTSSQTTSTNTESTETAEAATDSTTAENTQTENTEAAAASTVQSDATVGQVTSVADGSITIAVGTLKDMGAQNGGGAPSGDAVNGENPEASENDGTAPSAPNGDKPASAPSGDAASGTAEQGEAPANQTAPADGEKPSMIDLTGEELTVTVSDSTTITIKGMDQSTTAGTIDDIKEGDIITVTLADDGKTATEITVQSFDMGKGQGQGQPGDAAQNAGSSTSTTESSEN